MIFVIAVVETTVPWCFKYGEEEWMNPYKIKEPGKPDRWSVFQDYFEDADADADDDDDLKMECN